MKLLHPVSQSQSSKKDLAINIFWDTLDLAETHSHVSAPPIPSENGYVTNPTSVVERHSQYSRPLSGASNETSISGATNIFFLPIRISGKDPDVTYEVTLKDLLLLPTGLKGQYRSVGLFEAYDWCSPRWGCRVGILSKFPGLKTETKFENGSGYYEESNGQRQGVISII